jgi:excisionase family DNA binding protein
MNQALQGGMANTVQGGAPQQQVGTATPAAAAAVPAVMSPADAARYLQVSEEDINQMVTDGTIKSKKIGSQVRISKQALDDFLNS